VVEKVVHYARSLIQLSRYYGLTAIVSQRKRSQPVREKLESTDARYEAQKSKKMSYREYELLVTKVFESLVSLEGANLTKSRVRHDVRLPAITKGLKRQIDVLWEFELGGISFQTVIQAKHWKSRVTLPMIDTFHSVMRDLPGSPKGVMITSTGFQSGAFEYARQHGIALYELRPADELPDSLLPTTIMIDWFWYSLGKLDLVFTERISSDYQRELTKRVEDGNLEFHSADGSVCSTLDQALEATRSNVPAEGSFQGEQDFSGSNYVRADDGTLLRMEKVRASWLYERMVPTQYIGSVITHILALVTGETAYFVDQELTVRRIGERHEQVGEAVDTRPFREKKRRGQITFSVR
jgi:hypothetical protein